ncbi:PREDICTED: protein bride of sevenless [Ceratosolen solmsi marchali]|uniref:Protein bride of sevenless n=1 Tax=Ceratosolen solmsi marchali TaxID=326594 RepID=A0AAJ7DWT6_9HYME|nr:PREDICTED: protein bride of sevenless [Ceratosolen solmsi marchali]
MIGWYIEVNRKMLIRLQGTTATNDQSTSSSFATQELVCPKNYTFMEITGDAVLSVFVDSDYGSECNISSSKSIDEVAIASFVVQTLNKMGYVPGVEIGLHVYDTCNDRISVYKQALISAVEMGCSAHYDLGILAPERFMEVLESLRSLNVLPVYTYGSPNLNFVLIDALVEFISTRYTTIDLILSSSWTILDRFLNVSREAGICVRSDKDIERRNNDTELVLVALGDYNDVSIWIDEQENAEEEDVKRIWIVLPVDNSYVDELLPEGSYVLKPEQFPLDVSQGLESANISQLPVDTIIHSPYLLSIGKAIVEIVKAFQDRKAESCPLGALGCTFPRMDSQERRSMSNARLYETLHIPAKSYSTRYTISQKMDGTMLEITGYKIDATSVHFRILAENKQLRLPRFCIKNCMQCINFQTQDGTNIDESPVMEIELGTLKTELWVPIVLTIVSCITLACFLVFALILYLFFMADVLDGNPTLTILLILSTIFMLQSIVPFCLYERAKDTDQLNASKIFVSSLSFGLVFSVMLTRALCLAFSTSDVFSQHINGYLQSFMLFFMAAVELAISTMYFVLGSNDSAHVIRSPFYIVLLSYDVFLLLLLFIVCCFIPHIQRNYNEGMCFFGTTIGLVICWTTWITCFLFITADKRDLIICCGILGTACLIFIGILAPQTYFMCMRLYREKNLVGRFESMDFSPDPRMNNTARQALDLQSCQSMYDYMNCNNNDVPHQQHHQQQISVANYYGSASPKNKYEMNHHILEPRHTPGYSNYGFRTEMRELDDVYVIPQLHIEDSDVSLDPHKFKIKPPTVKCRKSSKSRTETRNAFPKLPMQKARSSRQRNERDNCIETEVYVEDRLSPVRHGPNERYPQRSCSPRLSPTHATIREEGESAYTTRITRF